MTALSGKKILITREQKQAEYFSEKVREHGGIPLEVPLLKIAAIDREENLDLLRTWANYEWIFFTSANGVHCYFQLLKKHGISASGFETKKIAAVGHKTEDALKQYHYEADFIPTLYDAETMAAEFFKFEKGEGPILIVRGTRSRDVLPDFFTTHDIPYDMVTVYETVYNYSAEEQLRHVLREETIDFITFTSPSIVEAFLEMAENKPDSVYVCIGTTTERRAQELGFTNLITPKQFTVDEMIDEMIAFNKGRIG